MITHSCPDALHDFPQVPDQVAENGLGKNTDKIPGSLEEKESTNPHLYFELKNYFLTDTLKVSSVHFCNFIHRKCAGSFIILHKDCFFYSNLVADDFF
jgi:hypothetical protein